MTTSISFTLEELRELKKACRKANLKDLEELIDRTIKTREALAEINDRLPIPHDQERR